MQNTLTRTLGILIEKIRQALTGRRRAVAIPVPVHKYPPVQNRYTRT